MTCEQVGGVLGSVGLLWSRCSQFERHMGALVNPWFHTQNRIFPAWEPKEAKKMWFFCLNHCVFVLVGHRDCAIKSQNISGESKTSVDGDFDRSDFQNNALNARFWIFLFGSTHKARDFQHFCCSFHVRILEKNFQTSKNWFSKKCI